MILIDTRTVLISYIISNVICASMMITLWRQNRRRSPELVFWMADFIMQFIGVVLLTLRGVLPDFFSMVLSNILIVGGTFLLLIGLERYLRKTGTQWHNHLFMAAFVLIHLFFVFNQPNMLIRTLNNSLGIFVFCSQGAWLLLWRVEPSVRQDTWGAGAVFAGFSLVSLFRIFVNLIVPPENDLFKSGLFDTLVILIYQMLTISLALSLFLMVNQRLNKEIQQDKENLELIFNTSPDAVLVTRITDGYFIDINEGFTAMTGYSRADVLGKSTLEINLWKDAAERQRMVAALNEKGYFENMEAVFQRKDKSELIGIISARLISLQGVPHIISVTRDITERKLAEEALRESETKLQSILAKSRDAIGVSQNGIHIFTNPSYATMFGYDGSDELIGTPIINLIAPESREMVKKNVQDRARGIPVSSDYEAFALRKDGSTFLMDVRVSTYTLQGGLYTLVILRDITERRQAEEKLRESEEKFRSLLESQEGNIMVLDFDGVHHYVNQAGIASINGSGTAQNIIGKRLHDLYPAHNVDWQLEQIRQVITTGQGMSGDFQNVVNDQSSWWHLNLQPIRNASGQVVQVMVNSHDITARKQAEERLRESEERYHSLFNSMDEGLAINEAVLDENGDVVDYIILSINPAFEKHTIYKTEQVLGKRATEVYQMSPEYIRGWWRNHSQIVVSAHTEMYHEPSKRWFHVTTTPPEGKRFATIFIDITERRQAEEELNKIQYLLKETERIGKLGGWEFNTDTGKQIWTEETYRIHEVDLDYDPTVRKGLEFYTPASRPIIELAVRRASEYGEAFDVELEIVTAKGNLRVVHAIGNSDLEHHRVYGFFQDITVRKQAEEKIRQLNAELEQRVEERTYELRDAQEQLVRHEKLSVLGQLSSSVGHELRNPLSVIASAVYYLKLIQPDADDKVKQYLGVIDEEVRNSDKIITDLLDFARVKSVDREPVSVSDLIRRTLERFPVPEFVEVILDTPADLPQVFVDPRQMIQVLGNLTVNAWQAMRGSTADAPKGGQLSLHSILQNDMINITVQDNGVGILPENMKKIFEPLFTTKTKGIGLGLAVSQKLVDANGGRIEVESEAGKGTSFYVYLPIYGEVPVIVRDEESE